MTENNISEVPKKKISLQEAMKKQLEIKKNQTSTGKGKMNGDHTTKKMKSQQTKKNNKYPQKNGFINERIKSESLTIKGKDFYFSFKILLNCNCTREKRKRGGRRDKG